MTGPGVVGSCYRPALARRLCEARHELSDLGATDNGPAERAAQLQVAPERFGGAQPVGEWSALLDRRRAPLQFGARGRGPRLFVEPGDRGPRAVSTGLIGAGAGVVTGLRADPAFSFGTTGSAEELRAEKRRRRRRAARSAAAHASISP